MFDLQPYMFVFCLAGMMVSASTKSSLASIDSLSFTADQMTTGQRSLPVSQLRCVGGTAQGLYEVPKMICKNLGGHGAGDLSWSCSADLPPEFKLGSADVHCEGWNSSKDTEYILSGSCGCEYSLYLADQGEAAFPDYHGAQESASGQHDSFAGQAVKAVFFIIFGIIFFNIINSWRASAADRARRPARRARPGGAAHNGDDDDDNDDQPGGSPPSGSTTANSWTPLAMAGIAGSGALAYDRYGRHASESEHSSRAGPSSAPSNTTTTIHSSDFRPSTGFGETHMR